MRGPAQPLTQDEVDELHAEGAAELVVMVDGQPYNDEDLHHCGGCGLRTPYRLDLDDDGLCPDCAAEADAEEEHIRQLRSDYYASVL